MYKQILLNIIEKNKEDSFFCSGINEEKISFIEKELNIVLPNDYKWFLRTFGAGGIKDIKIFGYDKSDKLSVITKTNYYRKYKLPHQYVVIGAWHGDLIYCLDTTKTENSTVVSWNKEDRDIYIIDDDFLSFFYEQLNIACVTKEDVFKFIDSATNGEYFTKKYFTGGVGMEKVDYIEKELSVTLPDSYKWFLKTFGYGGIEGIEIIGYDKCTPPSVVVETKEYREYGLPEKYVVIEDCDEFIYCLDTSKMENNECPVISWDMQDSILFEEKNFIRFFFRELLNMKND